MKNGPDSPRRDYNQHRTIDRVIRLLEEVVERPGLTLADLTRTLEMPKSTTHNFIDGLLAKGWLYERLDGSQYKLYLGPAVHSLILNSGQIRAGLVSRGDLERLQEEVDAEIYLGVLVADQLFLVAEAGADPVAGYHPRRTTRRDLLNSAGGKLLVALQDDRWIEAYFRRRQVEDPRVVENFVSELATIRAERISTNLSQNGTRYGIAGVLSTKTGDVVASVTVVGSTASLEPRRERIIESLRAHVRRWEAQDVHPREAV